MALRLSDLAAWMYTHGTEATAIAVAQDLLDVRGQEYRFRMTALSDSDLLAKVKAAPKEIRDAVDAIALPVDEKPAAIA